MFIKYLDQSTNESNFELAWTRFVNINIGILAAIIVGCLFWPNHARVRYFRAVSTVLERATEYCECRLGAQPIRPADRQTCR